MWTRIGSIACLVAVTLCASVMAASSQTPARGAAPECDPRELCLRYDPFDRLGRTVNPSEYKYQFHDPFLATVTAGSLNPDGLAPGVKREIVLVPGLPGRDRLPMLEGRSAVSVALYRQHRPARLMFILGGIGASPFFGLATHYAAVFHREGAHVVILPSPMTWNFALGASRSGTPGYTPDDARDLYSLMQTTLTLLRSRYGIEVTGIDFMGVSLGALDGAFLSVLDADEGRIGIDRYLLLNPPPDTSYALRKLHEWQSLGARLGRERAIAVGAKAQRLFEDYIEDRRHNPNASFDRVIQQFSRLSTEELQFVFAQYLSLVLPELVYVTQAIEDQRVLQAPRHEGRKRLQEAKGFTLKDYEEKIAVPRWQRQRGGASGESLNERGSLGTVLDRLRDNPRVHIMHNADDILAEPLAIEEVKAIMGRQMTLYPYGGHLGNLWYAQNQEDIVRFFETPVAASPISSRAAGR